MRHIFHSTLLLLLTVLALSSCASFYQITGASELLGSEGSTLYLVDMDHQDVMAQASIEHGSFSMQGDVDSVRMVTLYMDEEGIMPIILENGNIKVRLSNSQLRASGTPLNDKLYKFIDERNEMGRKLNELERQVNQMAHLGAMAVKERQKVYEKEEALTEQINEHAIKFIKGNYDNVLGPSVFMMLTSALPYPIINTDIERILDGAPDGFLRNAYVSDFVEKAKENQSILERHRGSGRHSEEYHYDDGFMQFSIQESFEFYGSPD